MPKPKEKACDKSGCHGTATRDDYCGAYVCGTCGAHVGLDRCYCGWSRHGYDGFAELREMGETIEADG